MEIKHSIVTWDSTYRNFFHLIDGLIAQNYSRENFELIYVEQRTRKIADAYNHNLGLKSLWDRYQEVKSKINIKIIYLGLPFKIPYHNGRCNNAGLNVTKGEIISIMDGDQLLPPDFLRKLTAYHLNHPKAVINLDRRCAMYPVGVNSYKEWRKGSKDFKKCLDACISKYSPVPEIARNKPPMISSRNKFWKLIEGCDPHLIWSTVSSRFGIDVTRRLEIASGTRAIALADCFSVHPWHPIGAGVLRSTDEDSKKLFALQDKLIKWSLKHKDPRYSSRTNYINNFCESNKLLINKIVYSSERRGESMKFKIKNNNLLIDKIKCRCGQLLRKYFYKIIEAQKVSSEKF
ncbi:MAG: glycosyltransferase family 2 protein [Candidatus Nealsonbacteria bacterium]|nr:MAG: glycosyltransferase family 2 protein [Candidatus Nealsonbacteria bacterium]